MSALIQRPTFEILKIVDNENGPFVSELMQVPKTAAYNVYALGDYSVNATVVEWTIDKIVYVRLVTFDASNTPGLFYATRLDDTMFLRVTLGAGVVGATVGIR